MRIDDTHRFLGLRLNDSTSIVVLTSALALLLWRGLTRQPSLDDTVDLVIDGS